VRAEGCWEQYASGRALVQEAQELAKASPAMARDLLRLAGDEPEMITGLMVTQAAQEGDVAALRSFDVVGTLARLVSDSERPRIKALVDGLLAEHPR
jgi:predicted NBD/HSP70 family sugar kinase